MLKKNKEENIFLEEKMNDENDQNNSVPVTTVTIYNELKRKMNKPLRTTEPFPISKSSIKANEKAGKMRKKGEFEVGLSNENLHTGFQMNENDNSNILPVATPYFPETQENLDMADISLFSVGPDFDGWDNL